jgi:hypothetical protein
MDSRLDSTSGCSVREATNDHRNPTFVISHHMPLERAAEARWMFDLKGDDALKIVLSA